jgi:ssDNA-binding Zn-finger/Zn-ribbon topoisomerase 1
MTGDLFTEPRPAGAIECEDCGRFYVGIVALVDHMTGAGRHGSECDANLAADRAAGLIRMTVTRRNRPRAMVRCGSCHGSTWVYRGTGNSYRTVVCPECRGTGKVLENEDTDRPAPGSWPETPSFHRHPSMGRDAFTDPEFDGPSA